MRATFNLLKFLSNFTEISISLSSSLFIWITFNIFKLISWFSTHITYTVQKFCNIMVNVLNLKDR